MNRRLKNFKNGTNEVLNIRIQCNDVTVELRHSKKDDYMDKRRNIDENAIFSQSSSASSNNNSFMQCDDFVRIMTKLKSDNQNTVYRAAREARKLLSREHSPPITSLIDHGIVPIFVDLLEAPR